MTARSSRLSATDHAVGQRDDGRRVVADWTRPPRSPKLGATMSDKVRAFFVRQPHQALGRSVLAVAAGVLVALLAPVRAGYVVRLLVGWDTTAVVMSGLAWWLITRAGVHETRHRAADDDPGRTAIWGLLLLASAISLFTTSVALRQARTLAPEARELFVALCLMAVISAWTLTHTVYTLRYAHLYYRDGGAGEGGLTFPSAAKATPPTYLDFAYFAFTIGMCFQVSDVTICSRQIRRAALAHAMLSFAYNTVILAVALNLVVGLFG
jgi:uncharacterized membrane protein